MHGRMCCPHQEISEVQATFNGACKLTVDNTGPEFGFSGLSSARRPTFPRQHKSTSAIMHRNGVFLKKHYLEESSIILRVHQMFRRTPTRNVDDVFISSML